MFLELNCDDFIEVQEKEKKVVVLSFRPPHNRNIEVRDSHVEVVP